MRLTLPAAVFLLIFCSHSAHALRCGTHLVEHGDSMTRVQKHCGEPESKYSKKIYRTLGAIGGSHYTNTSAAIKAEVTVETQVDEWEYNFGPRRFSRRVIFEDGRVADIERLDYGD